MHCVIMVLNYLNGCLYGLISDRDLSEPIVVISFDATDPKH